MLVGEGEKVPTVTGSLVEYANLDYAASTPALVDVWNRVEEFLPWYSSVHRGSGFKSIVSSAAYEGARAVVHRFFDARAGDVVLFTRNTTDSANLLAQCLPLGTRVAVFATEHHANLLPWRLPGLVLHQLAPPTSPDEAAGELQACLSEHSDIALVCFTGASNVTGEIWPIQRLTAIAHAHGARVFLDAAQMAAHIPMSLQNLGADYMAASGHKMYAPFGAGILIGPTDWLSASEPYLRGGGAVDYVTLDDVMWTSLPERQEAGSPNVVGAVALARACQSLANLGMSEIAEREIGLGKYLRNQLQSVSDLEIYSLWSESESEPRLGIVAFNLIGYDHGLVAAVLSAEHGIGVRHGCFCAHPLMVRLLCVDPSSAQQIRTNVKEHRKDLVPGAVRASVGLGSNEDDVDRLVAALVELRDLGPQWNYRVEATSGEYFPDPDTRALPVSAGTVVSG